MRPTRRMTPRARGLLFALPLAVALLFLGIGLPGAGPPGPFPMAPGFFRLRTPGTYELGVQYANATGGTTVAATLVSRADFWETFTAVVNATDSLRITGSWTATDPVLVVVAWHAVWTANSSVITPTTCGGFPGQYCPVSLVVNGTAGTLDFTMGVGNPLCTSPSGVLGPCIQIPGDGGQQMFVSHSSNFTAPEGSTLLSVTFISFLPAVVTVVRPVAVDAV